METEASSTTLKPVLADKPTSVRVLYFLGILLLSFSLFSFLGIALLQPLFSLSPVLIAGMEDQLDIPSVRNALEFLQIIQAVGVFFVPTLLFAFLMDRKPFKYLGLTTSVPVFSFIAVLIIMMLGQPIINKLVEWNAAMSLPSALSGLEEWMKIAEDQAKKITASFLNISGANDFMIVFTMVAILPALGEELLFRGVIQRLFREWTGKKHLAILITAVLFSAIHMQFYGFVPRMLLGMLLGYLYEWSGSLWLPVAAHFINNGSAVILSFLFKKGMISFDPDQIGTSGNNYLLLFTSTILVTGLLLFLYRTFHPRINMNTGSE